MKEHHTVKNLNMLSRLMFEDKINPATFLFFSKKALFDYLAHCQNHLPEGQRFNFVFMKAFDRALQAGLSKQYNSIENRYERGLLVEALKQYGCSKTQAYQALGEWLDLKSDTTLETAHAEYKKLCQLYEEMYDFDEQTFIERRHIEILDAVSVMIDKPFPKKFPKAARAYADLLSDCIRMAKRDEIEAEDFCITDLIKTCPI